MKRARLWVLALICCICSAGCGAEAVDLSEEDTKRVADFSSDIISQHNQYSNSRLADVEEVKWEYQKQVDLEIKKKNFIAQQRAAGLMPDAGGETKDPSGSGDSGSASGEGEAEEVPLIPMVEAVGLPAGVSMRYQGYEVTNSYPTGATEGSVYMGMTAAQGDSLVVLHFDLVNETDSDVMCDILSNRPQFRIRVNGDRNTIQQTILPNDLSKFADVIPAGSSVETVLISEMATPKTEDIESVSLIVRSAEGRPEYPLEESAGGEVAPEAAAGEPAAEGFEGAEASAGEAAADGNTIVE